MSIIVCLKKNDLILINIYVFQDVKGKEKTCAHWDFTLNNNRGGWSAKGCVYNGTVNGRDICHCNHLTNFAVLIVSLRTILIFNKS